VGTHLRHAIAVCSSALAPYVTKVIPNFRAAHYAYIIFMVFFTSVILYPISDFRYIDILFLMGGASTQAGLNTVNIKDLRLLQQILVYFSAMLTTPIFIHSSLLLVRLYWFEQYFDNIKETSKLNFRMRRNATLAARSDSVDPTVLNTANNQGLGLNGARTPHSAKNNDASSNIDPIDCGSAGAGDDSAIVAFKRLRSPSSLTDAIRFAELPHPKRRLEIEPSDMYKSIHMLQHLRKNSVAEDDVLVIKAPNEIERDSHTPIYTTKPADRRRSKWNFGDKSKKGWQSLRKTLSNTSGMVRLKDLSEKDRTDGDGDGEDKADGRIDDRTDDDRTDDDDGAKDGDDDNGVTDEDDGKVDKHKRSRRDKSRSETGSVNDDDAQEKSYDAPQPPSDANRKTKFALDPSMDRLRRLRPAVREKLRRWRTPIFSRLNSRSHTSMRSEDDEDGSGDRAVDFMSTNYLSWTPTIGRNSTFVALSDEQKQELGGVEYRATKLLLKVLAFFYCGFHIMALCLYVGFIQVAKSYKLQIDQIGVDPTWWGIFTGASVFNDLGFTLTPNSMGSFSRSAYVLVFSSFFIVIGNTGFPMMLRFIIWIMFKLARPLSQHKESLGFLLDHPRRCFTLLFPSVPTWRLFIILVVLNVTDLILFIVLDLNNEYLEEIPTGYRILDGLFQAFSTRTAGFSVVDLSKLHLGIQVSYMIMMYISVLPLAISIRQTNVYEEQSLGVYVQAPVTQNADDNNSFVGAHLRNQLSFDLWFIFLGLFIICVAEGSRVNSNLSFTVFSFLFEIISAYGTVGLSLGYPGIDQSLSNQFCTVSKLVIIAMMIRGRHRGLPYALDRAIMVPNENMLRRDRVQESHALAR
ncbi:potassium transport protein TRK1/TRK2, partial [Metschnikowia bicuspidata]